MLKFKDPKSPPAMPGFDGQVRLSYRLWRASLRSAPEWHFVSVLSPTRDLVF